MQKNYQCSKCGAHTHVNSGMPASSACPKGGYHMWSIMSRFIKQMFNW